jgi:hypothetical protein
LVAEPNQRYKTCNEIQNHAFILQINLQTIRDSNIVPPIVPRLKSEYDTRYFDDFSNPEDMEAYGDIKRGHLELGQKINNGFNSGIRSSFIGFTFKHRFPTSS